MAKKTKPSQEELEAALARAIANAESITDGSLSTEREEVLRYYRGELPKPLHRGDSKYVSRDVFDTVDSMRATVLEAFSSGNRIVFFRPERGETAAQAKQASEYCRHVFFKENDGQTIMYEALTDGLMSRFSVTKVYFEEDDREDEYEFEDLTAEELGVQLEQQEGYEFTSAAVSKEGLYSGSYVIRQKRKRIVCEVIQPEDLLVASGSTNLCDARYVIHRTVRTRSWLVKTYGEAKVKDVKFNDAGNTFNYEKQARFGSIGDALGQDSGNDRATEETTFYEIYIRMDADGSGRARLWKFDYVDGTILEQEQIARLPFASFVPLPIPHTYYGENYAQGVIPVQNARTVLIRQIINHSLVTNNPRMQVMKGTLAKPTELLDNRLGGIVNVNRLDGLMPIMQQPLNPYVFNLISMIDEDKEETSGISKLSQGLNKDAISTQNSQGMVEQLISASQQRTKIVSRRFGKYLCDLWLLIYTTALDHIDEAEYVEATGSYVDVTPSLWLERSAASVELTLGYAEEMAESQKWMELDAGLSQDPELKQLYPLEKRYEVLTRAAEKRGIEDFSALLLKPEEVQPPPPDPMAEVELKIKTAQAEYTMSQAEAMRTKAQTDLLNAQANMMKAKAALLAAESKATIETGRLELDTHVDMAELELARKAPEQTAVYNPS